MGDVGFVAELDVGRGNQGGDDSRVEFTRSKDARKRWGYLRKPLDARLRVARTRTRAGPLWNARDWLLSKSRLPRPFPRGPAHNARRAPRESGGVGAAAGGER